MDSSLFFMVVLLNGIEYSGPVSVGTYFGKGAQYDRGTIDSIYGNGLVFNFYQIFCSDRKESRPWRLLLQKQGLCIHSYLLCQH